MRWVGAALAKAPPPTPITIAFGAAAAVLGPTVVLLLVLNSRSKRRPQGWGDLRSLKHFTVHEVLADETVSTDGYAVLLGRFQWQDEIERALIKLRPQVMRVSPSNSNSSKASLLSLLMCMSLRVSLESGAEYGYFKGSLSPAALWRAGSSLNYDVEVIAPASERQIVRARPEERFLVRETGEMYDKALKPLIEGIRRDGKSILWVYNILDHKKETERVIYEDPHPTTGFILVSDPKWKSHPNPETVPKSRWYKDPSIQNLGCLAICHDRTIGSMRELGKEHLPLLENILYAGLQKIQEVYGVEPERVRVYVHYLPQFFHFHVHFSRVHLMHGVEAERAHLLIDIIDNIKADPDYYRRAPITYSVKKSEEAYRRLHEAGLFHAPP